MKTYKIFINEDIIDEDSIALTGYNGDEVAIITGSKSQLNKVRNELSHDLSFSNMRIEDADDYLDDKGEPFSGNTLKISASKWLRIQ